MSIPRDFSFERRLPQLLLLGLLALAAYFIAGWFRFYHEVESFRKQASAFELPVIPSEALVVLTGDQHRIPQALRFLRRRGSPLLIISGTGRGTTLTALVNQQGNAADIQDIWQKILLEQKSTSTIENAEETARIAKERHLTRLILVTSDYHMPRSLRLFRTEMPTIEIVPFAVSAPKAPGETSRGWENAWHMWVEYWKYFIFDHFIFSHLKPYDDASAGDRAGTSLSSTAA